MGGEARRGDVGEGRGASQRRDVTASQGLGLLGNSAVTPWHGGRQIPAGCFSNRGSPGPQPLPKASVGFLYHQQMPVCWAPRRPAAAWTIYPPAFTCFSLG